MMSRLGGGGRGCRGRGGGRAVRCRPWEVERPIRELAATQFSKLVVCGDYSPVLESICDTLAASLRAKHVHVVGAGHATPDTATCLTTRSRRSSELLKAE